MLKVTCIFIVRQIGRLKSRNVVQRQKKKECKTIMPSLINLRTQYQFSIHKKLFSANISRLSKYKTSRRLHGKTFSSVRNNCQYQGCVHNYVGSTHSDWNGLKSLKDAFKTLFLFLKLFFIIFLERKFVCTFLDWLMLNLSRSLVFRTVHNFLLLSSMNVTMLFCMLQQT